MANRFPYRQSAGTPTLLGTPASVFGSVKCFAKIRWFLYECAFLFMAISIRLFLDFFLKFSTGLCLLVSSLHEARSLLLFFLAPSRFLLPFLKGFTCHKNSFQLWVPR